MLEPLGAGRLGLGYGGEDIRPAVDAGVPGLGMDNDMTHYFEVHHSRADTFDKVDAADLAKNGAILAVAAYALADLPGRLAEP